MNIPSKTKPRGDIKIIIVGNSGTGKTSFCNVWTNKEFKENMKATIMTAFTNTKTPYTKFNFGHWR